MFAFHVIVCVLVPSTEKSSSRLCTRAFFQNNLQTARWGAWFSRWYYDHLYMHILNFIFCLLNQNLRLCPACSLAFFEHVGATLSSLWRFKITYVSLTSGRIMRKWGCQKLLLQRIKDVYFQRYHLEYVLPQFLSIS